MIFLAITFTDGVLAKEAQCGNMLFDIVNVSILPSKTSYIVAYYIAFFYYLINISARSNGSQLLCYLKIKIYVKYVTQWTITHWLIGVNK